MSGSTAGFLTSDPDLSGQLLTWNGPFTLAANSNVFFHFDVAFDSTIDVGDYTMTASAVTDATYTGKTTLTVQALTPLIFVPGVMGSKLDCGGINVWPAAALNKSGLLSGGWLSPTTGRPSPRASRQ